MRDKPLLLESILLENGKIPHLDDHQKRLNNSHAFYYSGRTTIDLEKAIHIPETCQKGTYKIRVLYGGSVEKIEFQPYTLRPVEALQMVPIQALDYIHKYADRSTLQSLFQNRTYGDDVLLIRNGLLTDTSYANVALYNGNKWVTPAHPLLPGTARARYLRAGLLHPADISYKALGQFVHLKLINSMMAWEEAPCIEITQIKS